MTISTAHRAARNQATIDLASSGGGPASIKLYTAAGGTVLGMRTLAQPCGVITSEGRIQLLPALTNDLVVTTGEPTWGELCTGAGVPIWGAAVTNEAGAGPFKLAGTDTMIIYAGGVIVLASPALLG